jgi:hypothetical protein
MQKKDKREKDEGQRLTNISDSQLSVLIVWIDSSFNRMMFVAWDGSLVAFGLVVGRFVVGFRMSWFFALE